MGKSEVTALTVNLNVFVESPKKISTQLTGTKTNLKFKGYKVIF